MTTQTKITIGGDLPVNRVGYGAMRLPGPELLGDYPDRDGGIALLRGAVEAGVSLIDTADIYGPHTSESLIRAALHPYPEHLVIATKGGMVRGGRDLSTVDVIGNPNYLRQCACLSARRLGLEQIGLYYLHSPRARDASFEDQVGTLAELRKEGLIRHIGLSNVTVEQLRAALAITEIAAVTAYFNVAARQNAPVQRAAAEAGLVFCPWQPVSLIQPGFSTDTDGPAPVRRALEPIAARHHATIPQVALAWLLARSPLIAPIPATTSLTHQRQNLDAEQFELAPEELAAISALVPEPAVSSPAIRSLQKIRIIAANGRLLRLDRPAELRARPSDDREDVGPYCLRAPLERTAEFPSAASSGRITLIATRRLPGARAR
jgi:pyridoxine 4-dehydrogenase